jgi:hypothetical protein
MLSVKSRQRSQQLARCSTASLKPDRIFWEPFPQHQTSLKQLPPSLLTAHQQRELSRTANDLTTTAQHRHSLFQVTCPLAAHSLLKRGGLVVAVCAVAILHLIQAAALVATRDQQ